MHKMVGGMVGRRAAKESAPERGTHQKSFPAYPILVTESKHHTRRLVMLLLQQPSFLLPTFGPNLRTTLSNPG